MDFLPESSSMCVKTILDASAFRHFCAHTRHSAGDQLRRWIDRGDGVIVYSTAHAKYAAELNSNTEVRDRLFNYVKNLQAIDIDLACIEAAKARIPDRPIRKSDDPHILALAMASEAVVLFSCDKRLRKDFANPAVLHKVGRQDRRSVPDLRDNCPEDTTKASNRRKFLAKRTCDSCC